MLRFGIPGRYHTSTSSSQLCIVSLQGYSFALSRTPFVSVLGCIAFHIFVTVLTFILELLFLWRWREASRSEVIGVGAKRRVALVEAGEGGSNFHRVPLL